ncbi:anti-repressor SinI family protein [Lentibacillus sediminis]|uniref:anti-repressor SinI family protein n=1 Tax=Lentibacillus sediminis TaxID=1940529 RepID=UPI000C1C2950|nr:anti-repressor SinI family protein [Lentibacillus sediminis]
MSKEKEVMEQPADATLKRRERPLYQEQQLKDKEQALNNAVDPEWVELLQMARDMGININEVRQILSDFSVDKSPDALH